jgi:hypothetical protein
MPVATQIGDTVFSLLAKQVVLLGGQVAVGDTRTTLLAKALARSGGKPAVGDTEFSLLAKRVGLKGGKPASGDTEFTLLAKQAALSGRQPAVGDTEFTLLAKQNAGLTKPPVQVILGETTIETSLSGSGAAGNIYCFQYNLAISNAVLQSISLYIDNGSGNAILGIYDSSGAGGTPGKLIAETASTFINTAGWHQLPTTANPTLAAGNYWLAMSMDVTNLVFVYGGTSYPLNYVSGTYTGSLPDPYPTSGQTANATPPYHFSQYATLLA